MSKTNKAGKASMRTRFEEFRNDLQVTYVEKGEVKVNQERTDQIQAKANYLWSNVTSNVHKIKAKLKKEFGDEVKA